MKGAKIYFTPMELLELEYIISEYWRSYDKSKIKDGKEIVEKLKSKIEPEYNKVAERYGKKLREQLDKMSAEDKVVG